MRKYFTVVVSLIYLSSTTFLHAKYKDVGLSGSLGFMYEDESYSYDERESTQQRFNQEYELRYSGNIYSPNLFSYNIYSLMRFDDTKQQGDNANATQSDSQDYGTTLSFLKKSNFPFRVYYSKTQRPTSNVYVDRVVNLLSERENYGLSGSVKLNKINIRYEASQNETLEESLGTLQERSTFRYGSSLTYENEKNNFRLSYLHTDTDDTKFVDNNVTTDVTFQADESDDVSLSYGTKLTNDLRFSSTLGYNTTSVNETEVMTSNFTLAWSPDADYSGGVSLSLSSLEYSIEDFNSTETTVSTTDTMDISQNFNYKINENFSLSESINYFTYESENASSETSALTLSLKYAYSKRLNAQRVLNFRSSLRGSMRNTKRSTVDSNTTAVDVTTQNTVDYSFINTLSITEMLPSINSRLYGSIGVSTSQSSSVVTNRYNANLSLSSKFNKFTNIFDARYEYTDTVSTMSVGDNLNYSTLVGLKGNLAASIGAEIRTSKAETTTSSELIKARLNFKYRFFRKLQFSTITTVNKDLGYNTLNYGNKTMFSYRAGLSTMSLSYDYDYASTTSSTDKTVSQRSVVRAKFKRKF
jgi:hypothetical protein